jgi:WD40 repeat protein
VLVDDVIAAAPGGDVYRHLLEQARTIDLRSPRDGALLWSGRHRSGISNRYVAEAYATGRTRTMNQSAVRFSRILDDRRIWQELITPEQHRELWEVLSGRFAEQASGTVLVFDDRPHTKSVLWRRELPALRRNPAVGPSRIRFAYPPDGDLSEVARRPLTDSLRARVQFDDPDEPGYVDQTRLNRFTDVHAARRYLERIGAGVEARDGRPRVRLTGPQRAPRRNGPPRPPSLPDLPMPSGTGTLRSAMAVVVVLVLAAGCVGTTFLVRAAWPGFVKWLHTGAPTGVLDGHAGSVTAVAFSPDGNTVATGSHDGTAWLWDVTDRAKPRALGTLTGHTDWVSAVAFSPDGRLLATAGIDHAVRLWDMATRQTVRTLTGSAHGFWTLSFSPDGHTLAAGGGDITVWLWDVATGRNTATLTSQSPPVLLMPIVSVAFSPDGRLLATADDNDVVRLWDVASRRTIATITGHTDGGDSVAFSPDSRILAIARSVNYGQGAPTVRLVDMATRHTIRFLTGHAKGINAVAFSPDGHTLATGSRDTTVRLWDVETGQTTATITTHTRWVTAVAFSPDGRTLATGSEDKTVHLQLLH